MGLKEEMAKRLAGMIKKVKREQKIEFVDKFYKKNKHLPDVDYHVSQLCKQIDLQYDPSKKEEKKPK